LLVNFARWKQVEIRLSKSRLFYEEASWYDGQIWEKLFYFKNDKLLSTQNQFFNVFFVLFDSCGILFFLCFYCFLEVEIKISICQEIRL
jgi:hypothetical protein